MSGSSTRTTSSMYDLSSSCGGTLVPSPGMRRTPGGPPKVTEPTLSTATIRTGRRHCQNQRAQPISVPVVLGPDEQHVQVREAPRDLRRRGPVVRAPVALVAVLVEPHVPLVRGAQRPHVSEPGAQVPVVQVRLPDHVHPGAERLHQPDRRQVAPRVGHAQEPVAPARGDHAQGHPQVPRRRLDQDRPRPQGAVALGGVHHLAGRLQLDRPGEVEALALQVQRKLQRRPQVDVEV